MTDKKNDAQFFTIREVSGDLRVSPKTIRRAIDRGELKVHRFGATGRIIRIAAEDFRAFRAVRRR